MKFRDNLEAALRDAIAEGSKPEIALRLVGNEIVDLGSLSLKYEVIVDVNGRNIYPMQRSSLRSYYSLPQVVKTKLTILQLAPEHEVEGIGYMVRRGVVLFIDDVNELYDIAREMAL